MQRDELLSEIRKLGGVGGKWWLPKTSNQQVQGRLFFVNDELELEVDHGFQDLRQFRLPVEVVVGLLQDGTECSLSELRVVSMETSRAESGRTTYTIQLALLGVETEHPNQLRIRRLWLPLPITADWAKLRCYEMQSRGRRFTLKSSGRKRVPLGTTNGVGLAIFGGLGWEVGSIASQAPTLRVSSEVCLSRKEGLPLEIALQYLPTIVAFFSLATLSSIRFDHLSCESKAARLELLPSKPHDRKRYYYHPIVVWYNGLPTNPSDAGLRDNDMFLTYSDLEHAGQTGVLARVLSQHDDFNQLLPLMVPESGRFYSYSEQRFLNAAQVVETLDRMSGHNDDLNPEVFAKTKAEILENVRNPRSGWLEGLLEYANEPRLRARLKKVVGQNRALLPMSARTRESFINDVVNTRNYLVHRDKTKRGEALLDVRLISLTDKVEALARFTLLRHFGFSEEDLAYLLQQTERRYIQNLKALF